MLPTGDTSDPRPDRIDALKAKKAAIEAQIQRLNSAAAKEKRKLDTRRKILVGAVILEEVQRNPKYADWLRALLARSLKQERDRAAFNLPPLQASGPNTGAGQTAAEARRAEQV